MRLGQVVGVDRAAGHADDRQAGLGLPVPAEVVGHAHRAGRVAGHRVDAAVRRAGADGDDRRRLRAPAGRATRVVVIGWPVAGLLPNAAPVALVLDRLVRDRALDDQHERLELAAVGLVPPLDEVVGALLGAALEVDQRPVHGDLRQARAGRPSTISSMLGWVAAVSATESPSQLRPPFIQRMWTGPASVSGSATLVMPHRPSAV